MTPASGVDSAAERQMVLPLRWKAAQGQRDFFVSAANAHAVAFLDGWGTWPIPVALLVGPPGSGKSHLAAIFARRANARVWDDADRSSHEEALFHAWNAAVDERRPLLLTARSLPADWHVALPDLRSRLLATPHVRIGVPDDALLRALFLKLWRDRSVQLPADVTAYALLRIGRSFAAVARAVAIIDEAAMAQQRAVTIPLVREVLPLLAPDRW